MLTDPESINAAIDAALATLPEGSKGAIIAYADLREDGQTGITLSAYSKVNDHFSFETHVHWQPDADLEAGAEVRYVW